SGQVIVEAITREEIIASTWRRDGTAVARQDAAPPAPVAEPVAPATPAPPPVAMASAPAGLVVSGPAPSSGAEAPDTTGEPEAGVPAIPDALSALQHNDPPIRTAEPAVYLQFGAFSSPAGAQSLAQRLNDRLGRNAV